MCLGGYGMEKMVAESKTEVVYRVLLDRIINFTYDFDEIINEQAVAEEFGVSKTPAREALNMLVNDGFLKKFPRLGYSVVEISESDYRKLVYLRLTLEKGVLESIVLHASDEDIRSLYKYCVDDYVPYEVYETSNRRFHFAMAQITNNEYLVNELKRVFGLIRREPSRANYEVFSRNPHQRHRDIVAALLERDLDKAVSILREDCRRVDDLM